MTYDTTASTLEPGVMAAVAAGLAFVWRLRVRRT